jgi:hypothetical protein
MSARAFRGRGSDRAAPARRNAPAARAGSGGTRGTPANPRGRRRLPAIEVDRIVVMRIALVVVVLAFLYLVVWIGTRAFGSGAKQASRIDRVIIDATAPSSPATMPETNSNRPRPAPP